MIETYYSRNKEEFARKAKERSVRSPKPAFNSILQQAKKRNVVEINSEYLFELYDKQEGLCALSGVRMTWAGGGAKPTSISVDRIDNSKGYVEGNVRIVCMAVNAFRSTMDDAELLKFAKTLVSSMESKFTMRKCIEELV